MPLDCSVQDTAPNRYGLWHTIRESFPSPCWINYYAPSSVPCTKEKRKWGQFKPPLRRLGLLHSLVSYSPSTTNSTWPSESQFNIWISYRWKFLLHFTSQACKIWAWRNKWRKLRPLFWTEKGITMLNPKFWFRFLKMPDRHAKPSNPRLICNLPYFKWICHSEFESVP